MKPHLLIRSTNNRGSETRVTYAPSTKFYRADRDAGRPWITRLPFPVQVAERVEHIDRVSGSRAVSRTRITTATDGVEREFRGFAMVQQQDTERSRTTSSASRTSMAILDRRRSYQPP